jgi:hypothetical protein
MHVGHTMRFSLFYVTCVQSIFRTYKYLDSYAPGVSRNIYAVGLQVN